MCWLHEKTDGKARLNGCDSGPRTCRGNKTGFGPQDYWIDNDLDGFGEIWLRLKVWWLMLWHPKHTHKWEPINRANGTTVMRCEECKQYEDMSSL